MRDIDIRSKLRENLKSSYLNDPNSRVIEEFGLCNGTVRIDIATIDGALNGYEIKSDKDTLRRLPLQQKVYSQVFDKVIIVIGKQHSKNIKDEIPDWWGIWKVTKVANDIKIKVVRLPKINPSVDPQALAQCLWRDELLDILKLRGISRGLLSKSRVVLRNKLIENVTIDELKELVRIYLKTRCNWKPDPLPKSNDDLYQSYATA